MTTLPRRFLHALDRFNAAHPWDHNAHYHRWIMRQLSRGFRVALDVGSGTGDLARLLATRAAAVDAIDSDPAIVARAQELPPRCSGDLHRRGRAHRVPAASYDVITCVAALHHLPFPDALAHFRRHRAPGGILVVVGLWRARTPGDHLLGTAVLPLNAATGWIKNRGRTACPPASMTAPARPATMSFPEIVREARRILPGARLRRRLFWRYTLVWHQG